MKKYIYFISVFLSSACTSVVDFDIELNKHEGRLVVNSIFSTSDSIRLHLSRSVPVSSQEPDSYIENADIELYCQEALMGIMDHNGSGYYSLTNPIVANKTYSIAVNVPGYNTVSAESTVPDQVEIFSFDTISINKELLYCEIGFSNNTENLDYYLIELRSKYPVLDSDSILSKKLDIIKTDLIIDNGSLGSIDKRAFFSNAYLHDSSASVGFILDKPALVNSCIEGSNTVYIQFKKISEAYYKYIHFYYRSQSNKTEPSYTNTDNGYGIFAGYTVSVDSFEIRD